VNKIEVGHLLAGADLAEAHGGLTRPADDATVVDITQCHDGRLAINLERGQISCQPGDAVEVAQDVAPSARLAAVMPADWRRGAQETIAVFHDTPGSARGTWALVYPRLGRRWHACVTRDVTGRNETRLCTDVDSAADAVARALDTLAELRAAA